MALITQNKIVGKVCSRCRTWKSLEDFPKDRTHGPLQGGRHCRCKECHKIVRKLKSQIS